MSTSKKVLDSYALIAYFEDEPGAEQVKQLLIQAESGKTMLLMSMVNWGEVYYILYRSKGERIAEESKLVMDQLPITLVEADKPLTYQAARLKAKHAIAFGDCFAAALAMIHESQVVTGDPEFRRMESEVAVSWLGNPQNK
ncbi:MAG: type II toxin-antitoxin system VapC family toxin [Chloroflexota bacterium]|nr:type II toxin-antitoxin system VapC family toxin [Chloroflexota bacterium]